MQKRSHAQLASALLRGEGGFPSRKCELAFLLGSFQPDCNPLSYLKGSLRGKKFGGHTYGNSRPYIDSRIRALRSKEEWNLWNYYTLGKLTHYVADAFTYPHNAHFPKQGWAHHVYETELRKRLDRYLRENGVTVREIGVTVREDAGENLSEELSALHRSYMAGRGGYDRDLAYILRSGKLLMSGCRPRRRRKHRAA